MKKLTILFAAVVAILFSVTSFANARMVVTSTAINSKGFLADKYGYNDKTQLDTKEMPITSFPFEIKNAPKGTKSYAVFLEDKDAFLQLVKVFHGFTGWQQTSLLQKLQKTQVKINQISYKV